MQTWEAITSRRNARSFTSRPIPAAHLDQILEAGRRSPSSQNWQPWDFILVTGRGQLRELAKVWRGAGHVAGSAATMTSGSAVATRASPTYSSPANCSAFPRTATGLSWSPSATRRTARWRQSRIPDVGRSTRSCTAVAGRALCGRADGGSPPTTWLASYGSTPSALSSLLGKDFARVLRESAERYNCAERHS